MTLKQAVEILNYVSKEDWEKINQIYNVNDLSNALEVCYNGKRKKIISKTIDKIIDVYTLNGTILLTKAMMLIDESREQDAIHLLTLVPYDDKEFLFCIELIGMIYVNNFQFKKGIQTFSFLLTQELPEDRMAYIHQKRAICFQYEQDFISAFRDSISAIELYCEENEFYKEALLNLQLCIQNDQVLTIKEQIAFLESFCDKILEENLMYGPFLVAIEIAFLKKNSVKINQLKEKLEVSQFNENEILKKRIKKIMTFLKYIEKFIDLSKRISAEPMASFNHYLNPKISRQNFYKAERRLDDHISITKPIKDELNLTKNKMIKMNEEDFLHFEKMLNVNFLTNEN